MGHTFCLVSLGKNENLPDTVRYSTKHLVSQFLTFSHWLKIETSENWKALDKKNKIQANICRKSREEQWTPF